MLRGYRALTALAALPALAYTCGRAVRDGGWSYLLQRYGRALPDPGAGAVCVHCSSVGEVRTAVPLVRMLLREGEACILSVSTPTGMRMAARLLPEVPRVYFPVDHRGVVRRWLSRLAPRVLLVIETELWPELFAAAGERNIPLVLVNARLTARTTRTRGPLGRALCAAARSARCILARSEEDAQRFRKMGADAARIEVPGNLKTAVAGMLPQRQPPVPVPYVLAVSTHEDEEVRLWETWKELDACGHLLVLMPRYPERGTRIRAALRARGCVAYLHSEDGPPAADAQVYVADVLGEVPQWMRGCAFAFVGGSLIERGGHNVLEAAAQGRACVVGPHTGNFEAEVRLLAECSALAQVRDEGELADVFARWLEHPDEARKTGMRGHDCLLRQGDVLPRYRAALLRYGVLSQ